jgi:hypothetical protein
MPTEVAPTAPTDMPTDAVPAAMPTVVVPAAPAAVAPVIVPAALPPDVVSAARVPRSPRPASLAQQRAFPACPSPNFASPLALVSLCCKPDDPPCFVFHPDHPMPELLDDTAAASSLFGHSFGIPFSDSLGVLHTRQLSWPELLPGYSLALATMSPLPPPCTSLLADLRRCLPPVACTLLCAELLACHLQTASTPTSATSQVACCFTSSAHPLPTPATWAAAYAADPITDCLQRHLASGLAWSPAIISSLHSSLQQFARDDNLCIHHGRLVVRQSLQSGHSLLLIIVPSDLCRVIFDVFHGSPIGGHFGIYKTLFRIRMRFFWPRCRQDVIDWIKGCTHCILTDKSIRRHSKVLFSWPVTAPMFVLHCDLRSPGSTASDSGSSHLLSAMCDLTQFVVSVPPMTFMPTS